MQRLIENRARSFDIRIFTLFVSLIAVGNGYAQTPPTVDTNVWAADLSAGFTITGGNSDTLLATLGFNAQRNWPTDEVRFGANATYGENSGDVTTDRDTAVAQYKHP